MGFCLRGREIRDRKGEVDTDHRTGKSTFLQIISETQSQQSGVDSEIETTHNPLAGELPMIITLFSYEYDPWTLTGLRRPDSLGAE